MSIDNYVAFGVSQLKDLRIDNMPKPIRQRALEIREGLKEQSKNYAEETVAGELIKNLAGSSILEGRMRSDSELVKSRKAYLKSIKGFI